MEQSREERIQELKAMVEKDRGSEITWEEASKALATMEGLADIMFELWMKDRQRQKRLEESPKGFHLDGVGYTCYVCGNSTSKENSWYDKWGIKCMTCQKSIDRKEIPASLAKDKESWYSTFDLSHYFNIKAPTLKAWVKKGILKERIMYDEEGGIHLHLFLIKDNKDTLPPKELLKSKWVKVSKEGEENRYASHPWYNFGDPYEHLKGYKIMDHLKITEKDPKFEIIIS
jgi:hypothetical protein